MDLLQTITEIIKNFGSDEGIGGLLNYLKQNDFDLKKILSNLDPEKIVPFISLFLNTKGPEKTFPEPSRYLSPISSVADKDIVYALNQYFS